MHSPKIASAERRATLLSAGARVAKNVATILDPTALLNRTVDIICDEFGFYYAGVFLLDPSGLWAELQAGRGEAGAAMIAEGHKLSVGGNSMIGLATSRGEARIALDVGEEAVHFKNPHLPKTRSEMALPLAVGDEIIGALTVQSEEEAAFTQEDIATLQSMADQLAIAIKNARLHHENEALLRQAERHTRLLRAAAEVGQRSASILDLDDLLPRTVDIICEAYGFYYAGVFLLDESGEWAVLRAGRGEAGRAMTAGGHRLAVGGNSMIGAATGLREARIALDVGEERVHFKNPYLPHTRSEMALPLAVGDTVLGAVTVQSVEERAFSQEDIVTLQTMADHLAIAINNAQTLAELERANRELLRTRTYEAVAGATTQAIHWIGNKALPITTTVTRMEADLRTGQVDAASLLEDLELIGISAQQIVQVKENLLGTVREQQPRPADLADVAQAAAFHAGLSGAVTIQRAAGTPLALADTSQLARALANLFRNAVEAGATEVQVEIAPADERGAVALTVSDNGPGIPPELQDKVWASFITTKGPNHTGLGLPAALHVISELHGRIALESTPGEGARFHITLPASEGNGSADLRDLPAEHILLIDDEDEWATFLTTTLGEAGKQTERGGAINGGATPDLILVDDALGSASINDVLASLGEAGLLDRTIIVSPAMHVERTTRYMKAGVRDVALKPYTAAELAALLSR